LRGLIAGLFVPGWFVALIDSSIPVFIGRVVTLVSTIPPAVLLGEYWRQLLGMAAVLLLARRPR